MKHNIFFLNAEILKQYLKQYGRGVHSKDYEFAISVHAKEYFEEKLNQQFVITFEQNSKRHNFPNRFTPSLEQLREILTTYNEEDTPVDFALAPVSADKLEGYAYPFQIKRFYSTSLDRANEKLAAFINEKANKYRSSQVGLIIVPQMRGQETNTKSFDIKDLKSKLNIQEGAIRAVYVFQFFNETPKFIGLWASQEALAENIK
ncbi:hypothetical protein GYA49_01030 [Candidatus Beckwithbacteria bacterium]|nr:hypothetical protein [Candidatus Beckwithbacteria bacterium]